MRLCHLQKQLFISVPFSSRLTNKSMEAALAKRSACEDWSAFPAYIWRFTTAHSDEGRWIKCSRWSQGLPRGCGTLLHLLSTFPTVGQADYSVPGRGREGKASPIWSRSPLLVAYIKDEGLPQTPTLARRRVSRMKIMSNA